MYHPLEKRTAHTPCISLLADLQCSTAATEMAGQVAGSCLLCVGVVFKDVVSTCLHYPVEDQENRAVRQHWRIGGNAANSSTVLSLIGREAELLATLGAGSDAE